MKPMKLCSTFCPRSSRPPLRAPSPLPSSSPGLPSPPRSEPTLYSILNYLVEAFANAWRALLMLQVFCDQGRPQQARPPTSPPRHRCSDCSPELAGHAFPGTKEIDVHSYVESSKLHHQGVMKHIEQDFSTSEFFHKAALEIRRGGHVSAALEERPNIPIVPQAAVAQPMIRPHLERPCILPLLAPTRPDRFLPSTHSPSSPTRLHLTHTGASSPAPTPPTTWPRPSAPSPAPS